MKFGLGSGISPYSGRIQSKIEISNIRICTVGNLYALSDGKLQLLAVPSTFRVGFTQILEGGAKIQFSTDICKFTTENFMCAQNFNFCSWISPKWAYSFKFCIFDENFPTAQNLGGWVITLFVSLSVPSLTTPMEAMVTIEFESAVCVCDFLQLPDWLLDRTLTGSRVDIDWAWEWTVSSGCPLSSPVVTERPHGHTRTHTHSGRSSSSIIDSKSSFVSVDIGWPCWMEHPTILRCRLTFC